MKTTFKFLIGAPALGIAALALVACGDEAQQSAGESANKAVDAMKESAEEVKKKAGDVGEAIKEGFEKAKEKTTEMVHATEKAVHEGTGKAEQDTESKADSAKQAQAVHGTAEEVDKATTE